MSPRGYRFLAPISVVVAAPLLLAVADASKASGAPSRPVNPPSASAVAIDRPHIVHDQGDVKLRVPRVVIAATDGLPPTLVAGTAYVLELHVWVAGGESPMAAAVDVSDVSAQECAASTLPSGTISTIRCSLLPTGAGPVVVTVRVGPQDALVATATFAHTVGPPAG